jgi:hypothetical protein
LPHLHAHLLSFVPLLLAGTLAAQRSRAEPARPLVGSPLVGNSEKLLLHYERWKSGRDGGPRAPLVVPLGWSRGRSVLFTRARGEALLDLAGASVTVAVSGVGAEELGGAPGLDVWLELHDGGDGPAPAPFRLGTLPVSDGAGSLEVPIDPALAALEVEEVVLTRSGQGPLEGRVLLGAPDLFQRMAALELTRARELRGSELGGVPLRRPPPFGVRGAAPSWSAAALDGLVAEGERLFFQETFEGNRRTCGTCHPAENNFTLDPDFIATLPHDDPLFVAEREPALDSSQNGGRVFESPEHMRRFGLIVENVDGFEDLSAGFVLRAVQPTLGLAATLEPSPAFDQPLRHLTGWAGDGAPGRGSLREFAQGAVRQHFPRTLERREGVDFRLPDSDELSALEGFQLSLGRTEDPDIAALRLADPGARRGLQAFVFQGLCNACHVNGGGTSVFLGSTSAVFFDTGVEALEQHSLGGTGLFRPADGGFGTRPDGGFGERKPRPTGGFGNGRFNAPSLIEFADTLPAFHGHVTANPGAGLPNTVEGAVQFYLTQEFTDSEVGGGILALELTPRDIADIGRFLRVLNALENLRTVDEYVARALAEAEDRPRVDAERRLLRRLQLALLENKDALRVLDEVELHADVRAELREVEAGLQRARTASLAERIVELKRARSRLEHARALLVD